MEGYVQQFRVEDGVECKQGNCRAAIVDARELQVEFGTVELFRAGVDAASLNEFGLRVALIAREDMLSSFFDDVTHNRAAPVRVFTDLEALSSGSMSVDRQGLPEESPCTHR